MVGLVEVEKDLNDEREIREIARNKKVYFSSEYLVLYNKKTDNATIIRVRKEEPLDKTNDNFSFMRKVEGIEVLSKAEDTAIIRSKINPLSNSEILTVAHEIARRKRVKGVVFFGKYDHVNFAIVPEKVPTINVIDVVPPYPSRLLESLKTIRKTQLDIPVSFKFKRINILKIARELTKKFRPSLLVLPCSASGIPEVLNGSKVVFLDKKFDVKNDKIVLIGCKVSKEVFSENFPGKRFIFYNICPRKHKVDGYFITRCCLKNKTGPLMINGHLGYTVHWGDGYEEILTALDNILKKLT